MHIRTPAIVCSARPHGETGVVARLLTADYGLVGVFVAGGRGRQLRPVLIPGNGVEAQITARGGTGLPSARLELTVSRGQWMGEPLPAAAIGWVASLTSVALPERQPFPALAQALSPLLDAVCHAPSARGWAPAVLSYEVLLLRELGYGRQGGEGGGEKPLLPDGSDWGALLAGFEKMGRALKRRLFSDWPLAERRGDVMGARERLAQLLARMDATN